MQEKTNTTYNPKEIEEKYYRFWEESGYFEINGNEKIQKANKNFCIMLPPPNVTGSLHIGHALNHTLIDIIVRYKRMQGFKTLWQPGLDHAGIATQNVVEKQLLAQGIKKEEIGREAFIQKVWAWKEQSGGMILKQMRKLGSSPAWSRTRFTMDEGLQNAVKEVFVKLYNEGLIIQDKYLVNWCTHDGALSDIEVEYKENNGKLYYLRYFLEDSKDYIIVATTRPETYFGDTAVMVNPEDSRYSHLIGKKVILPLLNKAIPIIADSHVDMEFGTGAVKVTPAHDTNDYEVGKRHNLEQITIFDKKGILNEFAGEFEGLERLEAREKIITKLQETGFIEKIEDYKNQVGHCYRCGNVVEPYISKQWFLKKEIAAKAIEKINANQSNFFPPQWKNNYNAWMKELRDWCISRQLWWGHQIPVFYCDSCSNKWASAKTQLQCPKCQSTNIHQDPDVLDTWFSSALWAFSTLGYGNGKWGEGTLWQKDDLQNFYPNSLLITGFDILFFWVARMLMMGEHFLLELPFPNIYLHALVRDENGQKMSKSKGNVVDPLELIEKYSADVLRFTLATLCAQGRDVKLSSNQLEISKNFTNKLYNAANFLLLNAQKFPNLSDIQTPKTPLGKYMAELLSKTIQEVHQHLESYRFNDGANALYRFLWGEFCDWGIEFSKADKDSILELGAIFKESMLLLHPYMPFISEYLWHKLDGSTLEESGSIMVKPYPTFTYCDNSNLQIFELISDSIISIRRAKTTIELANQKIPKAYIKSNIVISKDFAPTFVKYVSKLAKVEEIEITSQKIPHCIVDITEKVESYIPIQEINLTPIISRLEKQQEKTQKEIIKLQSMLKNEKFIANAPAQVLETNKKALIEQEEKLIKIQAELKSLKG
ncbi:valine--tRNA ligase [Helicobacter pullorum]|uniref:valine--tRNA ligase n=1 Tax=Helicobacter pullorum TaxID=35818 RepID=UPI0008168AD5|nr:valine--tRNA ligase [Helicobacter pullorum]OCR05064.1 valine--tRNA ligase [Helicobacter pullorum]OCR06114.1 valine--tRNA ligase [Helicobacter pullorum]OCR10148.1 valine--tRNA ligase [Helicobacter pullorum]OCR12645.1 valine--tRNA ligase [Helicobacter pullorum]